MFVINTENKFTMEQIFYDGFVPEITFHQEKINNKKYFVFHRELNKNSAINISPLKEGGKNLYVGKKQKPKK